MELRSGLSSFASYGVKKQMPKLSSTRKRLTGVPLRRKRGEAAAVGEWASAPTLAPVLRKERGEEEGLAGREGDCLLCGSEKTWASPRQAPGEPLAKITCWNPWAGISWLRTASKCRHCLQVPSLPENHWEKTMALAGGCEGSEGAAPNSSPCSNVP